MTREKIAIIEDDPYFASNLKMKLQMSADTDVDLYISPDDFAEKITSNEDVNLYSFIIVDYLYGNFNASHKGISSYIRNDLAYTGKIFLWTLEEECNIRVKGGYDAILPKKYFTLNQLKGI